MNLFHFHRWKQYVRWYYDNRIQGGRAIDARYRYCKGCDTWEEEGGNWGGSWWDQCAKPKGEVEEYK